MIWLKNPSVDQNFITTRKNVLSDKAIKVIDSYISERREQSGEVLTADASANSDTEKRKLRISNILWINSGDDETKHLFNNIADVVNKVNEQYFNYNLYALENLQYSVYYGDENGHYDWHIDGLHKDTSKYIRKVSFSIGLNDPSEYEGGELQFFPQHYYDTNDQYGIAANGGAKLLKNEAVFFNSVLVHRVSPVTKGVRKSLVGWVHGPEWI
tara:strand:- start:9729 stop:10367 length:639 start_codon:yes stop_codon:yes gene_type:complete